MACTFFLNISIRKKIIFYFFSAKNIESLSELKNRLLCLVEIIIEKPTLFWFKLTVTFYIVTYNTIKYVVIE